MRRRLNCWVVAMWLWWSRRHARNYAWVRRSTEFGGLIPHFGYAELTPDGHLLVIDYIPPRGRLWTRDNIVIAFRGRYRATLFRREISKNFQSSTEAFSWAATPPQPKASSTDSCSAAPSGPASPRSGACTDDVA